MSTIGWIIVAAARAARRGAGRHRGAVEALAIVLTSNAQELASALQR